MSHYVERSTGSATWEHRRDPGLLQLILTLALAGGAVYEIAGLPRIPGGPPSLPQDPELQLELLIRSPTPEQLNAAVLLLGWVFWMGWAFIVATTLLRITVIVAMHGADGAAWVRSLRWLSDLLTLPFVRRVVDTSMAGALLVRVAVVAPSPPVAVAASVVAQVDQTPESDGAAPTSSAAAPTRAYLADLQPGDILHVARSGESLAFLGERYHGDPNAWKQIYADNRDRPQPDGGSLKEAGKIIPGWVLIIRNPAQLVEYDAEGLAWHTVRHGESMWGIADIILGDGGRWPEIFAPNQGAELGDGHVLTDPNVIWTGLRLRIPSLDKLVSEPSADAPPENAITAPDPATTPVVSAAADHSDRADMREAHVDRATPSPTVPEAAPATTGAVELTASPPTPTATPERTPAASSVAEPKRPVTPAEAAVAAGVTAAATVAAGRLVVRRRRPAPVPTEPESDVNVEDGFAEADPIHHLARRLAHTADPATVIASLLGRAYAAVFDEQLQGNRREEASRGVSVAATRHGRTSTTLVLAAPVAARPHLVNHMRAAAVHAFGEHVDVDGQIDQNGDVLVRVTWHPRRPLSEHLLKRVDAADRSALASAWAAPCLVPALVLHDRQHLAINWHTLRNVLVAAPTGQGADVPLTALVAALASVRAPEDLGLVVVARQHTVPDEIGLLPHGLGDVVDPGDPQAVQRALESVKLEVERRRQNGSFGDADLVMVVRELADLEPDAQLLLGAIAAGGPEHGVQLVLASDRPTAELLSRCPFVDQLGTRLVLQAATEEDSVALLGMPGAERLGAGGYALLRLEGRLPVPGWAYRLPADRLARLVHMMGARASAPAVLEVPARPFRDPNEISSTPVRAADPTRIAQTNHGGTEAGPSAGRSIRKLPAHTATGLTFLVDDISEAWPIVWVDTTKRPELIGLWNASPAAGMLAGVELHWNTVTYAGTDVVVAYVLVGRPVRAEFFLEFALPASESFLEYIVRNPHLALMQGLPRRNEAGRIRPSLDDLRGALKIAVPDPQILADELTQWRRRHGAAPEHP